MWNDFSTKPPEAGLVLLPENGWEALLLAVAGPGRGIRYPKGNIYKEVTVFTTTAGATTVRKVPFTDEDQKMIDDFLDEYLVAAGFEPRPRGYDWYLRLPNEIASLDELGVLLNAAQREENADGYPAQVRPVFERVIAKLYRD